MIFDQIRDGSVGEHMPVGIPFWRCVVESRILQLLGARNDSALRVALLSRFCRLSIRKRRPRRRQENNNKN